jgi:prophage antirepressor-like protein
MSDLITISNVRGFIDENGTAQLNIEDISRGLGFTTVATSGNECVRWSRVQEYLSDFGFSQQVGKDNFIPENFFYLLAMKASNQTAVAFQMKVANEILPSIRKTGSYSTQLTPTQALLKSVELLEKQEREFNQMKEAQTQQATAIANQEFKLSEIDQKVTNEITLTTFDQSKIQGAVLSRASKFEGKPYPKLYSALKRHFGVPSYRDIKKSDLSKAFQFINSWSPSERKWA